MGTKKTPLAQTSYNSGVETDYIFPGVRQEKIYVKPFGTPMPGGFALYG